MSGEPRTMATEAQTDQLEKIKQNLARWEECWANWGYVGSIPEMNVPMPRVHEALKWLVAEVERQQCVQGDLRVLLGLGSGAGKP